VLVAVPVLAPVAAIAISPLLPVSLAKISASKGGANGLCSAKRLPAAHFVRFVHNFSSARSSKG
jgi:hypothetical protein